MIGEEAHSLRADWITPLILLPQVCVAQCPKQNFLASNYYGYSSLAGLAAEQQPICLVGKPAPRTGAELKQSVERKECAEWYMKSIACKYTL